MYLVGKLNCKGHTFDLRACESMSELTIDVVKSGLDKSDIEFYLNQYKYINENGSVINTDFEYIINNNIDIDTLDVFKIRKSSIGMYYGKSFWAYQLKVMKELMDSLNYSHLVYTDGIIKHYNIKNTYAELTMHKDKSDLIYLHFIKDSFELTLSSVDYKVKYFDSKVKHSMPVKNTSVSLKSVVGSTTGGLEICRSIDELKTIKNLSYSNTEHWYFIETYTTFFKVLETLKTTSDIIGFDVETTGVSLNNMSRTYHDFVHTDNDCDVLVGFVFGVYGQPERYYIPLRHQHTSFKNLFTDFSDSEYYNKILNDIDNFYYSDALKTEIKTYVNSIREGKSVFDIPYFGDYICMGYMRDILENKKICCFNGSFEWKTCWIYNINLNLVQDPMVMSYLVKSTLKYESHNLKYLSNYELGIDSLELDDFSPTSKWEDLNITFGNLDKQRVFYYVFNDITTMFELLKIYTKEVLESGQSFIYSLEVAFSKAVGYSEFWGYRIDKSDLEQLSKELSTKLQALENDFFNLLGVAPFNTASPKQLKEVLNNNGFPDLESTSEDALEEYSGNEVIDKLLEIRTLQTILKNFVQKLPNFIRKDGRIYSSVFSLGARTGRLTAKDPNYMQANDIVKNYTKAGHGFYFIDTDFNQIEYRVIASLSGQEELIEMFKDPDSDYHTYQTARMHRIPYEMVTKELRSMTKKINFGLPYGMGDSTLGLRLFGKRNDETKRKAAEMRRLYFEQQKKVLEFFEKTRDEGVKKGYTATAFGRRRYYDFDRYSVWTIRRQAGNARIQGTALDIFKLAMVNTFKAICQNNLLDKFRITCFIHDEGLFEVSEEINPYFALKLIRENFEKSFEGFCPIMTGAGVAYTWGKAKSDKSEIKYELGHALYEKADTVIWKNSKYYCDKPFDKLFEEELF